MRTFYFVMYDIKLNMVGLLFSDVLDKLIIIIDCHRQVLSKSPKIHIFLKLNTTELNFTNEHNWSTGTTTCMWY